MKSKFLKRALCGAMALCMTAALISCGDSGNNGGNSAGGGQSNSGNTGGTKGRKKSL